jgi:Fe-S oxidoreductase
MATRDEADSTRGRANILRLAMNGQLRADDPGDEGVRRVLDLCLECRACKSECPVGVDVARFKSEFLAGYWRRHGVDRHARAMGAVRAIARLGSRTAPISNWVAHSAFARGLGERFVGVDRRRRLPAFARRPLTRLAVPASAPEVVLFADTFTNYYEPGNGQAAMCVLAAAGLRVGLVAGACCGRPKISKGLLDDACRAATSVVRRLHAHARHGRRIVFCEPSCLSAIREDVPDLLRGEERRRAQEVAAMSVLFEEIADGFRDRLRLRPGPARVLLHPHCHQKSMGLADAAAALLSGLPGTSVTVLDAGCCGMAGSFGYAREHFDVSRAIAERRLLPAVRARPAGTVVVSSGTSCRHQLRDLAGEMAVHPAVLLQDHLEARR